MARAGTRSGIIRRFGSDRRGVSAVEFALIAPLMIVFYFGLVELCQGFMALKRMTHVSSTVADLATQEASLSAAEIADLFAAGNVIMAPFPTPALSQRISSVSVDANGVARIDWSRGQGMSARAAGSTIAVPAGLVENGESLIMTEVSYDYDSAIDYIVKGITRFSHTYYLRPRVSDKVTLR